MLRIIKESSDPQEQIVYSFGDHYDFRKKLSILNLLTGYNFSLPHIIIQTFESGPCSSISYKSIVNNIRYNNVKLSV